MEAADAVETKGVGSSVALIEVAIDGGLQG